MFAISACEESLRHDLSEASSDDDKFLACVGRQELQRFLASVFEHQCNRLAKIREAFFARFALAVCVWNFRAIRDVPRAILLDNRCELVAHTSYSN
jgi:hypothetical protein